MIGSSEHIILSDSTKLSRIFNYFVWKFTIKSILQKEDLYDVVVSNPNQGLVVTTNTIGDPTTIKAIGEEAVRILAHHKQRELVTLCLSIRNEIIPYIGKE